MFTVILSRIRTWWRNLRAKSLRQQVRELFLQPGETSEQKAIAFAFGIFMGIIPFWGYQTITAVALAHFLRMNKGIVLLGTLVSIPPIAPFLIYISYLIGGLFAGEVAVESTLSEGFSYEMITQHFGQYLIGSLTVAAAASLVLGLVAYLIIRYTVPVNESLNSEVV